ncbi:hypothetical protein AB7C87_05690 [Natrarchaeobius sp. A-rgal3]|uniref:hypothetical protein n=1 Tax=Natrarchaeobius versutus TaxID=1679078 RepID=UPI00350ECC2D
MGARTDATLTVFVLVAVVVGFVLTNASFSSYAFALGGLATLSFEAVAARQAERVRDWWERPLVQAGSLAAALLAVAVGARVAPDAALSLFGGAAVTYLVFLFLVQANFVPPPGAGR